MTRRTAKTTLTLALALLLNAAWAGAGGLVVCLGADGHTHVKLAGKSGCTEAKTGGLRPSQGRLQSPCDDIPMGDRVLSLPKKSSGRTPAIAAPPLPYPSGPWVARGPQLPRGATERAPFGQLLLVRTVVLRL